MGGAAGDAFMDNFLNFLRGMETAVTYEGAKTDAGLPKLP